MQHCDISATLTNPNLGAMATDTITVVHIIWIHS